MMTLEMSPRENSNRCETSAGSLIKAFPFDDDYPAKVVMIRRNTLC